MKTTFTRLMLTMLLLVASVAIWAYDVKVDGIYYNLDTGNKTASVTNDDSKYSGAVTIPETIVSDGVIYSVTSISDEAFYYCNGLKSITIPNSVTSIGYEAFYYCTSLTSITIPHSVTSIGGLAFCCCNVTSITIPNSVTNIGVGAFGGCSSLKTLNYNAENATINTIGTEYQAFPTCIENVIFGDGVKSIPKYFLYGCTGLTQISIPNSVTSLGDYAFYNCSGLTSITIGSSVTSLGDDAFYGCTGLTSVTMPDALTTIGAYAFYGCSNLTSVTIPQNVTSIGSLAFNNCLELKTLNYNAIYATIPYNNSSLAFPSSITTLNIGNSVKVIPAKLAYKCTELTTLNMGNSVTYIGNFSFSGCTNLNSSLTIPESVTFIGQDAFGSCTGLRVLNYNAKNATTDFAITHSYSYLPFPSSITTLNIGNNVMTIPAYLAYNCTGLTSVTIPESVEIIGGSAFNGCTGLTSVTIPESVDSIGSYAFYDCTGVTTLNYNAKNAKYTNEGGALCRNITTLNIGSNVMIIPTYLASTCTGLTSVTIPESVESIGSYAFQGCSGLISVTIPESVENIGNYAFRDCTGLESVTIPESVESIGNYAFSGCTGLTSVTIPTSITNMGDNAFYNCSNIKDVYVSCKDLSDFAKYVSREDIYNVFYNGGCSDKPHHILVNSSELISANIPASVTTIGVCAFSNCTGLTSVSIPASVTTIGDHAFSNCTRLTSASIPESVSSIGKYAFYGCSNLMTTLNVPSTWVNIGYFAFNGVRLRTIISQQTEPSGFESAFSAATYTHAQLYVPEGTFWDYVYVSKWGEFINIKEMANNARELSETMPYMIADKDGCNYVVYDEESRALKNIDYTFGIDEEAEGSYWQISKIGAKCRLYNKAAGMWANMDTEGKITLSSAPVDLDIQTSDNGVITVNGNARMFVLCQNENILSGINYVKVGDSESQDSAPVYSISGQRLNAPQKGLNIIGGKKVIR